MLGLFTQYSEKLRRMCDAVCETMEKTCMCFIVFCFIVLFCTQCGLFHVGINSVLDYYVYMFKLEYSVKTQLWCFLKLRKLGVENVCQANQKSKLVFICVFCVWIGVNRIGLLASLLFSLSCRSVYMSRHSPTQRNTKLFSISFYFFHIHFFLSCIFLLAPTASQKV
jgi:hypothetical protein